MKNCVLKKSVHESGASSGRINAPLFRLLWSEILTEIDMSHVQIQVKDKKGNVLMTHKYPEREVDSIKDPNQRRRAQMAFYSKINNTEVLNDGTTIEYVFVE